MATFSLTPGPDTVVGDVADDTVNGTAATLNAGDRLTGGAGTDVLALYGSGSFRVDQLAVFTGFETISLNNFTNGGAYLYLGNQSVKVAGVGSGSEWIESLSAANWSATNVVDGSAAQSLYLQLNTSGTANASYDLKTNTFTHLAGLYGNGDNLTLNINSADAIGISYFYGGYSNQQLITSDTTLDLTHTSVSGFTVASSNATGTTFNVQDLGTAFQIAGGTGQDTISTLTFSFTAAQRDAIFATASVEKIVDASGTYTAGPSNPNTFKLTTGPDTINGTGADDTVNGTAATLNAGDRLTGGAGTDVLALYGSGSFRVDQLAVFTGFETISLNNFTNGGAYLYLGNQSVKVAGVGSGSEWIESLSAANWSATNVVDGSAAQSLYLQLNTSGTANASYDLKTNTFTHLAGLYGNGDNLTLNINSADAIGISYFYGGYSNQQLITSDTTLDLTHTSVSGFTVASSNATGTTFNVQDLGTAFQIAGGTGQDTISTLTFSFTAAQRDAIFATASVEKIIDASGTYYAINHQPIITSNGGGDSAILSIFENTTAVTTVAATDPDAGTTLGFSIVGGSDATKFQINPTSGALSFITAPDFEKPADADHNNSYLVKVRASDGALFDDQDITVNIADAPELLHDFNSDNHGDLLWRNDTGAVVTWDMHDRSYGAAVIANVSNDWHIAGTGDFNGDSNADIVWRNDSGGVSTWDMNDRGYGAMVIGNVSNDWHIAGTGDFNGDGTADILWRNDSGAVATWDMHDRSSGSLVIANVSNDWHIAGTGDFNGDGTADILWRNDSGAVATWDMHDRSFGSVVIANVSNDWHVAGTGDFNGDGTADILWRNDSGAVATWDMHDRSFGSVVIANVSNDWHIAGTADFDGDGNTDIAWRNDSGAVATWDMHDRSFTSVVIANVSNDWHIV
jgi:FG-GAP-like repeat/RTX calcium-binding nonapeptide repeat (4 copies)